MGFSTAAARATRLPRLWARSLPVARFGPELHQRPSAARRNLNVQASTGAGKLRTIDDLPGPSIATTAYWLFVKGYTDKLHLLQDVQKRIYGPIWRSKFGPFDMVNVASPEFISQVSRQEGCRPVRAQLHHWKEYMDMRGHAYGMHTGGPPDWYRIRSILNPKMLKPQEATAFTPIIQQVVGDLLKHIERLRTHSADQATVLDMAAEFYKFGFEGVSSILFETRLGCLQEQIPPDTLRFIAAVDEMLTLSDIVIFFPRWSRSILPYWKRFVQAWDVLYEVAQTLINRRVAEIKAQKSRGESAEGLYLTHLLASDQMSIGEVYTCITELLLGGVDTTSNTLSWSLYHLARDLRVQERLYAEVDSVCPDRRQPTSEDLSRMQYLKAVIKETLRLYPVVPGNARFVSENEVVVGDYWFPKKTMFHLCHYASSHNKEEFVDAELFVPERWLRCGAPRVYPHHPYCFIPFGVGVRACLGKRVAELEMYLALSRLMQHYEVQPEDGAPVVEPKTRTLLIPATPINLRFLPRA
ncbi:sterol 26-hydroxylase, mitochondrial [Centropristis striata]|uniref:sterol 26-hydroxylase, mitochondrial n=1 Tax=Centropristis striata TaxID=184440 RepID=UPI0027E031FE|nr:sterol 26-hydroxylase, mitochondrial [Centropristis striata]